MKKILHLFIFTLVFNTGFSQVIDSIRLFTDEALIDVTLTTDYKKLSSESGIDVYQDAQISFRMPDSTKVDANITLAARGHFRRDYCQIPPILLNFETPASVQLNNLGKLKLVIGCGTGTENEQLILKEYLCYKMYNLIEDKSFRVRLLRVNFLDSRNRSKPFSQYAFLIEDDADMARRNGCKKLDVSGINTETTHRPTMTTVAIFEYMVSNTDWSVPNNHNIKLLADKKDPNGPPYVVPYDFDHSGLVNAGYAVPNEVIGTESVTERVYRGFGRTMDELNMSIEKFKSQKDAIYNLIRNFQLIREKSRNEMITYIEAFYDIINSPSKVKKEFIDNARTN